jgi:hypothetical protein
VGFFMFADELASTVFTAILLGHEINFQIYRKR